MGPTATIPQDFGSLNSVVDVRTSATTTTTATPTTTAMPTSLPAPTLERTDAKIATVQEQPPVLEDVGTADEENIIPAPPQPQQSPGTTQMPAPMGSTGQTAPSEVITEAEPRMSVSETSMAYDTQLSDAVPLVTATIDIMSLPSGGGGIITTATPDQAMEIAPANIPGPEVMAGMDGVNTDPNAPGFSVSTVAPVQETIIAQYQVDQTGYTASTTTGSVASPDASITNESASRPPIWIRWLNTLGDWLAMILGQN
jgi:hypothetical protein